MSIWTPEGEYFGEDTNKVKALSLFTVGLTENNQVAVVWNENFLSRLKSAFFPERKRISDGVVKAITDSCNNRLLGADIHRHG